MRGRKSLSSKKSKGMFKRGADRRHPANGFKALNTRGGRKIT